MTHPTGGDLMAKARALVASWGDVPLGSVKVQERLIAHVAAALTAIDDQHEAINSQMDTIEAQSARLAAVEPDLMALAEAWVLAALAGERHYNLRPDAVVAKAAFAAAVERVNAELALRDKALGMATDYGNRADARIERQSQELAAMLADTRFLIGCIADSTEALDAMTLEETCRWAAIRERYSTPDGGSKHG